MNNAEIIHRFYSAFAYGDALAMIALYDDQIKFQDPAFGILSGDQAKSMWQMLVRPGVEISFSDVEADAKTGRANWVATYEFGPEKRKVTNRIHAEFEFRDGKIIRHTDSFNLWKWSAQAFGWKGVVLGWTSFMKRKVQETANARLRMFMDKKP